ncbi:MAG: 1-acyl-sn-glycerol-3-phosphate acyltransferase [Bacteroidales bacterium]|nr:1-acyl-sn-glycerol-3-phosphate acyltransferase [Bacteroidales bacterium]
MLKKIQEQDWFYKTLKFFVCRHIRRSFKRYHVIGRENIPDDGACIFGINHSNALTDALAMILSSRGYQLFMARADIFQNKLAGALLRRLKMLPIYRMRDGLDAVRDKNAAVIDEAIDSIYDGVPLHIFPEATHRAMHSLRPLSKGIFHIAFQANEKYGDKKPVYIVPVGIEYGDYFRFRSTALVSFGKPINITEYLKNNTEKTEPEKLLDLKNILTERLAELISYIPDNEDYDAIWELVKIKAGLPPVSLKRRRDRNKRYISKMVNFSKKEPEKAQNLFEKIRTFTKHRKEQGVSVTSVAKKRPFWRTLWKTLAITVGLPLFLVAAVVSSPIWVTAVSVIHGLKDKAFSNSVNFVVELLMHPLVMAVGITLLFCLVRWPIAIAGSIFLYYSYMFFYDYCQYVRKWMSDVRWIFSKELRKEFNDIKIP